MEKINWSATATACALLKWIVKKPDPHQNEKAAPAAELANPIDRMAQYWPLVINPQQRVLQTGL